MPISGRRIWGGGVWGVISFLLLVLVVGCSRRGEPVPGDVLYGRAPSKVQGVTDASRLTDGAVSHEGDAWETDLSSVFQSPVSSVEWDLGRPTRIRAVLLQGDNNDEFFLSGSDDGVHFREIWAMGTVRGAGMRIRERNDLEASARFLKLTARGGDSAVSVGELAVFEDVPPAWPPRLRALTGRRAIQPGEIETVVFSVIVSALLLLHRRTWPKWLLGFVLAIPIGLGAWTYRDVMTAWPPGQPVIDALRAGSAFVAGVAVLRLTLRPRDASPLFVTGTLTAMAALALTTFFNMWQPQFDDVVHGRHTWVHTWDMRVYYPTAKYFDEIGFDGLYTGSVAAYLEDAPGASESRIADVELRDLKTYDMTTVDAVLDQISSVKYRFSPQRWEAFKRDMKYFWQTMGSGGYLGSLRDHGGNATPAWLLVADLMFRHTVATERTLLLAALLDPLLLIVFFVAAWRTFGLRTALVCLVIYGASTFPWFGSNWAGSTLRNDWMVSVGLGVCALKARRWMLGGFLLAGGAMIRAFPAVSVFYLVAPALVAYAERAYRERRLVSLRETYGDLVPLVWALAGATLCVAIGVGASTAAFGFSHSWGDWAHKIAMHSVQPNINHVGLRTLIQFDPSKTLRALSQTGGDWSYWQIHTFIARRPLYVLAIAAFTALALAACRGRSLHQAALIGMMMIPIYFYPSNYYLHYVFILPLLIDESEEPAQRRLWGLVGVVMLLVCVSEYWGFENVGVDERYAQWSVGALLGYLAILLALARNAWPEVTEVAQTEPEQAPAPEPAPSP
jgi:hypothetical protein